MGTMRHVPIPAQLLTAKYLDSVINLSECDSLSNVATRRRQYYPTASRLPRLPMKCKDGHRIEPSLILGASRGSSELDDRRSSGYSEYRTYQPQRSGSPPRHFVPSSAAKKSGSRKCVCPMLSMAMLSVIRTRDPSSRSTPSPGGQ